MTMIKIFDELKNQNIGLSIREKRFIPIGSIVYVNDFFYDDLKLTFKNSASDYFWSIFKDKMLYVVDYSMKDNIKTYTLCFDKSLIGLSFDRTFDILIKQFKINKYDEELIKQYRLALLCFLSNMSIFFITEKEFNLLN